MTDFIDTLLTSMSSKFNETSPDLVPINLNEDKTLKWRGLHNNQFSKKRKDGKRIVEKNTPNTSTYVDDPPLINESVSCAVNADVIQPDETKVNENDSVVVESIEQQSNEKNSSSNSDMKNSSENVNNLNDKEKMSDSTKDYDQRPFRRLRRNNKMNDDMNDDVSIVNQGNSRKIGLRPKRQSLASTGSSNENNRSISPRGEKDEKMEKSNADAATLNRNSIMTRQRGRANQTKNTVDDLGETMPKTRNERKNSNTNEVDDATTNSQPKPIKFLRRSERTLHSTNSNDQKDFVQNQTSDSQTKIIIDVVDVEQPKLDKEPVTRSRKRTIDEKKTTTQDEAIIEEKTVPNEMEIDLSNEIELKVDSKNVTDVMEVKKNDDIEMTEIINDDQLANGSEVNASTSRKRGRKQPVAKSKSNLKLNTTITTRNTPSKKSPRFSTDESPFIYSIPKKDKLAAEQQVSSEYFEFFFL